MKNQRKTTVYAAIFIILGLIISISQNSTNAMNTPLSGVAIADLSEYNVAVYYGTTDTNAVVSRTALVNMYEWMNASVTVLNETDIQNGALEGYDILAMPGGNPISYSLDLGAVGFAAIRDWVNNGGSYFGICGGAMLACSHVIWNGDSASYWLRLFNGSTTGPVGDLSGIVSITIDNEYPGPNLTEISSPKGSLLTPDGGGYYEPYEGQEMITLATYDDLNDEPAIVVTTYGTGTVCLSAVHVEIEENSDRDGTDYYDATYDDPDTEWNLMLEISRWQIENSTWVTPSPTTSSTTSPFESSTTSTTSTAPSSTTTSTTDVTTSTGTESSPPPNTPIDLMVPAIAISGVVVLLVVAFVLMKRR